ncbi:MAG: PAS domain S-box protein [Candidatus Rokubacteria bacterium]|nr:PAS domain S-box protein [Candidatus Rokubacteria bacterium]
MPQRVPPYRVSVRLYVVFSLLMAVAATASGLVLLYLARPFITELGGQEAARATVLLFSGAALAGAAAAVAGLVVGLRVAGRIRGIARKAEALSPQTAGAAPSRATDEIGALDEAVGRLTLSMDRFVRDSDILTRLPEGMLLLGPAGELLSFNTAAEVLLELSLESFRGLPLLSSQGPLPALKGNDPLARLLDDATVGERSVHMSEVTATTAKGRELLLEITAQHREWGRDSTALVLLFRDATEKQRIREEIRRADQLAFLGGMAARVAHEIRTPLATIRGLVELLQADLPPSDSRREYMERLLQAVDRQNHLVENLLTLSHPEPEDWQPVPLPELLDDVVGMLPGDPRLRLARPPGSVPAAVGDAFRLSEVFANLIKNALEATPRDGTVEVTVGPGSRDRVRVSVRNTGSGIPAEVRERIFQPFFTTKSRGTGLGLAIARQIVDAHRGSLRVESDGVSETTFIVELSTTAPVVAAARG